MFNQLDTMPVRLDILECIVRGYRERPEMFDAPYDVFRFALAVRNNLDGGRRIDSPLEARKFMASRDHEFDDWLEDEYPYIERVLNYIHDAP